MVGVVGRLSTLHPLFSLISYFLLTIGYISYKGLKDVSEKGFLTSVDRFG